MVGAARSRTGLSRVIPTRADVDCSHCSDAAATVGRYFPEALREICCMSNDGGEVQRLEVIRLIEQNVLGTSNHKSLCSRVIRSLYWRARQRLLILEYLQSSPVALLMLRSDCGESSFNFNNAWPRTFHVVSLPQTSAPGVASAESSVVAFAKKTACTILVAPSSAAWSSA